MPTNGKKWLVQFADWAAKALIVAIIAMLLKLDQKQTELLNKIDSHQAQITELQSEVSIIRAQMVGWDTLTRIERSLGMLSAMGRGNQAMAAVADVLKAEREARAQK